MLGVSYEIMVPLPPRGRIDHRILLFRSDGRDFTERERLLLSLARPQLATLHETLLRRLAGEPELTTRQWELLRLVAAGLTNRQVGRCLHISEATVRKHLENIYQRLQVTSRTAAVARAFPTVVAADRQPMPWGLRE